MYQLMVEHTPEEDNQDWTKIEPSVSLLKSPKGYTADVWLQLAEGFFIQLLVMFTCLLPQNRQYWWSNGKFSKHTPHWLEGLPTSAVCPAGDCGLCSCWCCGLSEASGEEQEVLLNIRISKNSGDCRWKTLMWISYSCTNVDIVEMLDWKERWFESTE